MDTTLLRTLARLRAQERMFDPSTIRHLDDIGMQVGWCCAEIGAGAGSIAQWLARRGGPSGHVLAADVDTRFIAPLAAPGLEVRQFDITTEALEPGTFDLVHARLLLASLGQGRSRASALANMSAGLKPGGWLLVEECDMIAGSASRPASALHVKAAEALRQTLDRDGEDRYFGRKLRSALRTAGLVDIHTDVCPAHAAPDVDLFALTLEQHRADLVSAGLMRDEEIDRVVEEATRTLASDDYFATMVAAWGRRPAHL